jgi:anti-sigma regulatory factor (Ser/Thr protein kinase)
MEAGALSLEDTPIDVADLVDQTVTLMRSRALLKSITLTARYDVGVRDFGPLITDALRLRQVINNLVSNAIKFTPDHGSVTIGLTCSLAAPNRVRLRIAVTDTGMGIDDAVRELLFKPFSQLSTGHSRLGGTGLGLAISKRIVDAMGGQIGVDSEGAGRGSTFWITCELRMQRPMPVPRHARLAEEIASGSSPQASENRSSPGPPRDPPSLSLICTSGLRGLRMLVVEDNAVNAMLLCRQLKAVEVETVRSTAFTHRVISAR